MQFITFDGRLGKDAEVLTTAGGTKYLRFSVANNTFNNGTEKTEWYDVTSYDPFVIEKRAQYLTKGTYVIISGPIRYDVSVKGDKVWQNYYVTANSIDTPSFGKKDDAPLIQIAHVEPTPVVSAYTSQAASTPQVTAAKAQKPVYEASVQMPTMQPQVQVQQVQQQAYSSSYEDNGLPF